jgi:hypothetical protein
MNLLYSQRTADGPRDSILVMRGAAVFTDGVRRRFLAGNPLRATGGRLALRAVLASYR